jgi:hypothetical protein
MSGWEAAGPGGLRVLRRCWAWETMPHIGQPGFGANAISETFSERSPICRRVALYARLCRRRRCRVVVGVLPSHVSAPDAR